LAMGSARYSLLLRSARVAKPPLCPLPITKSTPSRQCECEHQQYWGAHQCQCD
jgi:hypothetical protein